MRADAIAAPRGMTFRAQIGLFTGLALATMLALMALAFSVMQRSEALADLVLIDVKLANASGSVDMMHDALRGDALAAQLAGPQAPEAQRQALREETGKHVKTMLEAFDSVDAAASKPEVRALVGPLKPAVQGYGTAAARLVDSALAGPVDATALQGFQQAFSDLETRLDALRDSVEASAAADVQAAAAWHLGA